MGTVGRPLVSVSSAQANYSIEYCIKLIIPRWYRANNSTQKFWVCSKSTSKSVHQTPWNDPSPPRKNRPHHKGEWDTQSLLEVSSAILSFFDMAKGISWLCVTLMGRPITRNFCSEKRFIVQEGYLRMRNRFTGSVDLNWVDDIIICEWKVFLRENLIYGGLLLLSPYANGTNSKTIITSTIYRMHTSITLSKWIMQQSFETIGD